MEANIRSLRQGLLRMAYLFAAIVLCLQPLGLSAYTGYFLYPTFGIVLLLWLSVLWPRPQTLDLLMLLIAALALVAVLCNGIAAGVTITVSYMKKYMLFMFTLLFLTAAGRLCIDRMTARLLFGLQLVFSLLLPCMLLLRRDAMYRLDGLASPLLTFGFTSSQLIGLFLACEIMFFVIVAMRTRSTGVRCASMAAAGLNAVLLYHTKCRTALGAVVAFLLLCLLRFLLRRWHKPIRKGALALGAVAPLLMVAVYQNMVSRPWVQKAFAFLMEEGKPLESRTDIWTSALSLLHDSPFFGAYYEAGQGTGVFQLHNTHLDTAVSYGILTLVLVCLFLYLLLRQAQEGEGDRPVSALAFMSVLLLGVGEAALLSGGLVFYLYAGLFLLHGDDSIP